MIASDVVSLAEIAPEPWKNGAGLTRTLASGHDGEGRLAWRVSVAEIGHGGPFSVFPGLDRVSVVLENGPLRLSCTEAHGQVATPRVLAAQYVPAAYPGELALFADVADALVRCLNVMTRRGAASAEVRVLDAAGQLAAGPTTVLLATGGGAWILDGGVDEGAALRLGPGDSVVLSATSAIRARPGAATGRLVAVRLTA